MLGRKLAAVEHYANSQSGRPMVDPQTVEMWARLRGSFVGLGYAEAFRVLRMIERPLTDSPSRVPRKSFRVRSTA